MAPARMLRLLAVAASAIVAAAVVASETPSVGLEPQCLPGTAGEQCVGSSEPDENSAIQRLVNKHGEQEGSQWGQHICPGSKCKDCLKILGVGDQGSVSTGEGHFQPIVAQSMAKVAQDYQPKIILGLGDNIYPLGSEKDDYSDILEKWYDVYIDGKESLQKPWYFIAGNHDYYSEGSCQREIDFTHDPLNKGNYWQFPFCYYKQTFWSNGLTVDMFFIDMEMVLKDRWLWFYPNPNCSPAMQDAWFEMSLRESKADWKLVVGHIPFFTTGSHSSAYFDYAPVRKYASLMQQYGVAMYFNGHNHNQEVIVKDDIYWVTAGNGAKQYLNDEYVKNHPEGFKTYEANGNEYLIYEDYYGCKRNDDLATLAPYSKMFSCSGGFMGLTILGEGEAELVMYDHDGRTKKDWVFQVRNRKPFAPFAVKTMATMASRSPGTCRGTVLPAFLCGNQTECAATQSCCTTTSSKVSCQELCANAGLTCKAALRNGDAGDDSCAGTAVGCDDAPGSGEGTVCTCEA